MNWIRFIKIEAAILIGTYLICWLVGYGNWEGYSIVLIITGIAVIAVGAYSMIGGMGLDTTMRTHNSATNAYDVQHDLRELQSQGRSRLYFLGEIGLVCGIPLGVGLMLNMLVEKFSV